MRLKTIRRRNHVGVSLWRGGRLVGGVCLLWRIRGSTPECYPRVHLGLDWHGHLWAYFSGARRGFAGGR
jgi:hypothetical protein